MVNYHVQMTISAYPIPVPKELIKTCTNCVEKKFFDFAELAQAMLDKYVLQDVT
jgi:hypothetical protein